MPEGHKAEKARQRNYNKEAGIGDKDGRIVRVKAAAVMLKCTACLQELKATKTNSELRAHAEGKHAKTLLECFPTAETVAAELLVAR